MTTLSVSDERPGCGSPSPGERSASRGEVRRMLADLPARAWTGIAAGWLRTLAQAGTFVLIGVVVDDLLAGADPRAGLVAASVTAIIAITAVAVADMAPHRLLADEERTWRRRIVSALLRPGRPRRTGADLALATDGVERIAGYRATFLGPTLTAFVAPALVLAVLAIAVDPLVAASTAVLMVFVPFLVAASLRRFRRPTAAFRRLAASASARFLDVLTHLGMLRLLRAEEHGRDVVRTAAEQLRREIVRIQRRSQVGILLNDTVFSIVMITAATVLAVAQHRAGAITTGSVVATLLLTTLLYEPLDVLGRSFFVGMAGRGQLVEAERLLADAPPQRHSAEAPTDPQTAPPTTPGATLALRGVSADRDGRPVLRDVDLDLPARGTLAVVGPSGAGKSTLARVLQGLVPLSAGEIRIGGRITNAEDRRRLIAAVPQTPFLFTGTIAENLRIADADATDDALWEALRFARIDDEVRAMPHRLETAVGEAGAALSGGQIRRLAIARAALSPSPVVVLDEPTADLDRRTEAAVTSSLRELAATRTIVVIAHRVQTTTDADLLMVLESGSPSTVGTPSAVRETNHYYAAALTEESRS